VSETRLRTRLGDILVERGLVARDRLEEALHEQARTHRRLGEVLVGLGALTPEQLTWALSEALHVPFVELSEDVIDLDVARGLPEDVLRRHEAVPILRVGNEMTVLLADPTNRQAVVELEALSGARVIIAVAAREAVLRFLDTAFPRRPARSADALFGGANGHGERSADPSGVSQAFGLLLDAVREGARELFVEPTPEGAVVRARVADRVAERTRLPRESVAPLMFRLRVLAGLRGEPGPRLTRFRTSLAGREVELELLFFPTVAGEAVTIRLEPRRDAPPSLDALGPSPAARAALREVLAGAGAPRGRGGVVLVAGADAGARAAALYALACAAAGVGQRALTVERSAGFVVPGFVQVELPTGFGEHAGTVLGQPADVVLVEDMVPPAVCVAALARAEEGSLVLGGLALASLRSALTHLAGADLRGPLLEWTRAVVEVRRQEDTRITEVLSLTPALRRDLIERKDPWTSRNS
jgi:type IV pilus assembly protein PilB